MQQHTDHDRQHFEFTADSKAPKKGNKTFRAIILFLIFMAGAFFMTQHLAGLFKYHAILGSPFIGEYYAPWQGILWYIKFRSQNPSIMDGVIMQYITYSVVGMAVYTFFVIFTDKAKIDSNVTWKGSAGFATMDDIKIMNLFSGKGVVVGSYTDKKGKNYMLQHDGPEHVLMVAPTGSGKGVSVVNPTLLTWSSSMVVYDLKKENWSLSSYWRKKHAGNTVLRFEPACADGTAARYNPLSAIRLNTDYDVADTQNIASIILEHGDEGGGKSGGDNQYFVEAAFGLLTAYMLHTCYYNLTQGKPIATLTDVSETLTDPTKDIKEILKVMREVRHKHGKPHPTCVSEATSLLNMLESDAGRQFAGIQGTIESKLKLYTDPIVKQNISASDFRVYDLMRRDEPVTLYICISSTDKSRMKPLTKLLFTQIIRQLTQEVEYTDGQSAPTYKHKLLMLIDEFPSLGKMSIMNESIAFLRGYGIRCLLIIQDYNQLRSQEAYGKEEAITANCGVQIAFTPNIFPTAEELSKRLGNTTIQTYDLSGSSNDAKAILGKSNSGSKTTRTESRAIMFADEIMRMPGIRVVNGKPRPGDSLILIAGHRPIYGKQILHFQNEILKARSELGALPKSDILEDTSMSIKEETGGDTEELEQVAA